MHISLTELKKIIRQQIILESNEEIKKKFVEVLKNNFGEKDSFKAYILGYYDAKDSNKQIQNLIDKIKKIKNKFEGIFIKPTKSGSAEILTKKGDKFIKITTVNNLDKLPEKIKKEVILNIDSKKIEMQFGPNKFNITSPNNYEQFIKSFKIKRTPNFYFLLVEKGEGYAATDIDSLIAGKFKKEDTATIEYSDFNPSLRELPSSGEGELPVMIVDITKDGVIKGKGIEIELDDKMIKTLITRMK